MDPISRIITPFAEEVTCEDNDVISYQFDEEGMHCGGNRGGGIYDTQCANKWEVSMGALSNATLHYHRHEVPTGPYSPALL